MICRMWHGKVPVAKASAYREFLNTRAIPDYRSVEGNLSVHLLERSETTLGCAQLTGRLPKARNVFADGDARLGIR